MTTVTRELFGSMFKAGTLDPQKLKGNQALARTLQAAGSSMEKLIAASGDLPRLFKFLDDFDHNGSAESFVTRDTAGVSTVAGAILDSVMSTVDVRTPGNVGSVPSTADGFSQRLAAEGKKYILSTMQCHCDLIDQRGIGTRYGCESSFAKLDEQEKQATLDQYAINGAHVTPGELIKSSCVDWALECVVNAYKAAGKGPRGAQIAKAVIDGDKMGTVLLRELQKDGWKILFWAADSKFPDEADGSREEHLAYVRMAVNQKKYWVVYPRESMKVDGYVMDFRPSSDGTTVLNEAGIQKLKNIDFAVGVAKGGTHTFAMHNGTVDEEHWDREPNDKDHLMSTALNEWEWSTGALAVPPDSWR